MWKKGVSLILLMLIITPIIHPTPAAAEEAPKPPRTVTAYIPAVIIRESSNETVIVRVDVTVTEGSGKVTVTGAPVDKIFVLTAKASAIISSFIYNYDYWAYDYSLRVSLNKTVSLAGPSGGLALTQAYYAAITGQNLSRSTISSGLINPDGTVGQVSYIKDKARGAANYTVFNIPLGQDVLKTNITTQTRIGPYPIDISKMKMEKLGINFGNTTINPSATVNDALAMSLASGFQGPAVPPDSPQFNDENINKAAKSVYNTFLYETLKKSDHLKTTMNLLIFRSQPLELYINSTLEMSDEIIDLSWNNQKQGHYFASMEILLQAYQRLNYIEYLLELLLNDFQSESIQDDVRSELIQANKAMNETGVGSIEGVKTKAYAKMLLIEATNLFNNGSPVLTYIYLADANKMFAAAAEGAIKMAQAKALAKEATLLLPLSSLMNGVYDIKDEDSHIDAKQYVDEVKTVYLYVYEISQESGVSSGFIPQAGYDITVAQNKIDVDPVLAMTYGAEAYYYLSTYMALHPGYNGIVDLRLPHIQQTTWNMLKGGGEERMAIIPWTYNQFSDALSTNTSKVMSYEKTISYLVLDNVIARDYKTGEIHTTYRDELMANEQTTQSQQQFFPLADLLAALVLLVLLGSIVSVSGRFPLSSKRFAANLHYSLSSKEADRPPR